VLLATWPSCSSSGQPSVVIYCLVDVAVGTRGLDLRLDPRRASTTNPQASSIFFSSSLHQPCFGSLQNKVDFHLLLTSKIRHLVPSSDPSPIASISIMASSNRVNDVSTARRYPKRVAALINYHEDSESDPDSESNPNPSSKVCGLSSLLT
jgi:hypothetical protein